MQYAYGTKIDMPAGPSEVLVIADAEATPSYVAADLIAQAEHGPDSQAILVTTSQEVINTVISEIGIQLESLPRKQIAERALEGSYSVVCETIDECMEVSNVYAPEHLLLHTKNPLELTKGVVNA